MGSDPVRIGVLTPLSETGAMLAGEMLVRGACLGSQYVRERGGIKGRQLQLVLADDQATAAREPMWRSAVGEMAKLAIVDKVIAVLGNWMVRTTELVAETSHRLRIPHFVTTGHPKITAMGYDTVFRTFYSIDDRAEIASHFLRDKGARRVGIMASTSPFGQFFANAVTDRIPFAEVLRVDFDPDGTTDFRNDLVRMREWGADFLINLGIIARDSAYNIINQAAEVGLLPDTPMLVGIPFPSAASDFWTRVGRNGISITWPSTSFRPGWSGLTLIGQWFVREYQKRYNGEFPSEMALTAFTDVTILCQALFMAREVNGESLIETLECQSFDTWRGPIRFERGPDHWHHAPAPLQLMRYQHVGDALEQAAIVYPRRGGGPEHVTGATPT